MIKIMKRMKVNFSTRYSLHKGGSPRPQPVYPS